MSLISSFPDGKGIPTAEKGAAGGVASLDSSGKVPSAQLPEMNYIPATEKGAASGVASLDSSGKLASAQTPGAGGVDYDNTTSGMAATTVQGAIDEIREDMEGMLDTNIVDHTLYLSTLFTVAEHTVTFNSL